VWLALTLKEEAPVRTTPLLATLVVAALVAATSPTEAGIRPYVRAAFIGNQLQVDNLNENIAADEQAFRDATGYPVELQRVGAAFGPDVSAGVWLARWLRVGATYVAQKESAEDDFWINHETTGYHYVDDLDLQIVEVGGEVMVRWERLMGLSFGGQAASGRARISESLDESDFWSEYHLRGSGERTRLTWATFVGFDQTNVKGIAGYVRAGYRFRDYGAMPARVTEWDASTTVTYETETIPLDYSGFFVSLGVGYDFRW
jgi:hypothetical protein